MLAPLPGCISCYTTIRWCRFAQPPATGAHPCRDGIHLQHQRSQQIRALAEGDAGDGFELLHPGAEVVIGGVTLGGAALVLVLVLVTTSADEFIQNGDLLFQSGEGIAPEGRRRCLESRLVSGASLWLQKPPKNSIWKSPALKTRDACRLRRTGEGFLLGSGRSAGVFQPSTR